MLKNLNAKSQRPPCIRSISTGVRISYQGWTSPTICLVLFKHTGCFQSSAQLAHTSGCCCKYKLQNLMFSLIKNTHSAKPFPGSWAKSRRPWPGSLAFFAVLWCQVLTWRDITSWLQYYVGEGMGWDGWKYQKNFCFLCFAGNGFIGPIRRAWFSCYDNANGPLGGSRAPLTALQACFCKLIAKLDSWTFYTVKWMHN